MSLLRSLEELRHNNKESVVKRYVSANHVGIGLIRSNIVQLAIICNLQNKFQASRGEQVFVR